MLQGHQPRFMVIPAWNSYQKIKLTGLRIVWKTVSRITIVWKAVLETEHSIPSEKIRPYDMKKINKLPEL
jgi:hypothetical protein